MRWLLQIGGRWLVSQLWRGVRGGAQSPPAGGTSAAAGEPRSQAGTKQPRPAADAVAQGCLLGVVCSSRRLFDGFSDSLLRRRTLVASQFRVASGLLEGAPVVVVLPHDTSASMTTVLTALIDGHHPRFVVSAGEGVSCGEQVLEGHVVVATELVGPAGERLDLEGTSPRAEWVHRGRVAASPNQPGEPLAIDAWSWQNAAACRVVGVPLVALSAITKPCPTRESPGAELLRPSTTLARRTGTFAGLAWRQPKELKRAWQLQAAAWQACDRAVKLVSFMAKASVGR